LIRLLKRLGTPLEKFKQVSIDLPAMKILAIFLIIFISNVASAQSVLGNWQQYINNTSFSDSPWRFQGDIIHRDHNLVGDLDQIIIRPGIQYVHAASKSSYLMGYAFFFIQDEGTPNNTILEHRLFQDVDFSHGVGRVNIHHRYRFEERFVESSPFAFRFRYALFVNIPLNKEKIEAGTVYIPIWNELFINAKGAPFDRNWLYAGIGYQLTDNFGMRFGAMNEFRNIKPKAQLLLSLHHKMHFGDIE